MAGACPPSSARPGSTNVSYCFAQRWLSYWDPLTLIPHGGGPLVLAVVPQLGQAAA